MQAYNSYRSYLRVAAGFVVVLSLVNVSGSTARAATPATNQSGVSVVSAASTGIRNAAAGMQAPTDSGTLLSSSAIAKPPAGSLGFQIRYRSYATSGAAIDVTGVAFVPARPAPKGGWPILSYAHGTVGLADVCTPSKNLTLLENVLAGTFNALGIAVVQSDYEGLGTEGRHPYLVGISEGRGVLDGAKAIRSLPGQTIGNRLVVWGHSQGGHAALFAAELAKTWAPQLTLKGVVAGAPPSQLGTVSSSLTSSPFRGYLLMVAAGMVQAYPNLNLSTVLTPKGIDVLPIVDKGCNTEVFAQANKYPLAELVKVEGLKDPAWAQALAENEPGVRKIDAPVFIIHGDKDEQVPVQTSATLAQAMCKKGTSVQRRLYVGADHGGAALLSLIDVSAWLKERLDGKPAPKGCR
jgi:dipeptidyl aminopeptidase/acylaminoacyl peptidase